jgi:sulfide dehydrogenase [flavocytochrome c] flavoprotein subunit
MITRRRFTGSTFGAGALAILGAPAVLRAQSQARVVVIGGGAGGATCARYIAKDSGGAVAVTLVEEQPQYTTCFYSNLYLAGWRDFDSITHSYDAMPSDVTVIHERAVAVDPDARTVELQSGETVDYDKLVVSPGIDLRFDAIEGYDEAAAEVMPHSWKAGAQTKLLKSQLEAMEDGGLFVIAAPPDPYRCPPGPYERVSCVADYFKREKPNARILILDPKEKFSKQGLFQAAWSDYYQGMIEWLPPDFGGHVVAVDPKAMTLTSRDGTVHEADVANVIPPQTAGRIAHEAGLTDDSGWCPVEAESMRSTMNPDIFVLGDATQAGDMPKSAFSANSQAKVAAMVIRSELTDARAFPARFRNACWSSLALEDAVKVGANYQPVDGRITSFDAFISEVGESGEVRLQTKQEADAWYESITTDIFG